VFRRRRGRRFRRGNDRVRHNRQDSTRVGSGSTAGDAGRETETFGRSPAIFEQKLFPEAGVTFLADQMAAMVRRPKREDRWPGTIPRMLRPRRRSEEALGARNFPGLKQQAFSFLRAWPLSMTSMLSTSMLSIGYAARADEIHTVNH
jgi:hypothetical protein